MLRTPRITERSHRSASRPHSGSVKASAGVTRYSTPASTGVRWAYSVASSGNSDESIDEVPEMRKPSPVNRRIGGRLAGCAGLRAAASAATAGTGRATAESRGTSNHTGSAGSSDRANATRNVRLKLPVPHVSRTPAMLLPTAPAVVFAVWYQAKADATAFFLPFWAMSAFTAGS